MTAAKLTSRDRRALLLLAVALLLAVILQMDFFSGSAGAPLRQASVNATGEKLLLAQVKARQAPLADSNREAAQRTLAAIEAQLLKSESAALAQAEMREVVGDLLKSEGIAMISSQFGNVELEGDSYASVPLIVNFGCAIEQMVNLMAAIANAPQLLATRRIRIAPGNLATKSIQVQLTVAGYLPASRTPELTKKASRPGASL